MGSGECPGVTDAGGNTDLQGEFEFQSWEPENYAYRLNTRNPSSHNPKEPMTYDSEF